MLEMRLSIKDLRILNVRITVCNRKKIQVKAKSSEAEETHC